MKALSAHHLGINEKRIFVNKYLLFSFISASASGFYGFLKFFSLILLLEIFRYITGIVEYFHFDFVDVVISLIGFIFNFFSGIANNYQKH